jgi:lipoic acid synthetase/lipoyl(octanoyl) transferase
MIALHVPLGRMTYDEAAELQRRTRDLRAVGRIPDVLFTVEHEPVFTRGRSARQASFRTSAEEIAKAGVAVRDSERGGDVTYHGPGQLVVYPILDLRTWNRDVKAHVRRLEEAAIRTLALYGLAASRREGLPGVWTECGKIASVGVSVRRWVSMHGLALNVGADAAHFAMIDPCGLPVKAVSMNDTLVPAAELADVETEFCRVYGELLGVRWREAVLGELPEVVHV